MDRRAFLTTTLAAGTTGSVASAAAAGDKKTVKILGISCSPRKGKTTAVALRNYLKTRSTGESHS